MIHVYWYDTFRTSSPRVLFPLSSLLTIWLYPLSAFRDPLWCFSLYLKIEITVSQTTLDIIYGTATILTGRDPLYLETLWQCSTILNFPYALYKISGKEYMKFIELLRRLIDKRKNLRPINLCSRKE